MTKKALGSTVLVLTAGLVIAACKDKPNVIEPPTSKSATLSFTLSFESPDAAIVGVDAARVQVERVSSGAEVIDTTIAVTDTIFSTTDAIEVDVVYSGSSEVFEGILTLQLSGTDMFTSDPVRVTVSSAAPPAVDIELRYIGPGADATGVAFAPGSPVVFYGNTLVLQASGSDASGPNPLIPVAFASLDPSIATVPDPSAASVLAGAQRGTARITARLLTGQADTIGVLVQPPPDSAAVVAGASQTAEVLTALNPVTLRVLGVDSQPVTGALVTFSGDGTFAPESVVTDANGDAMTVWTLGPTAGTQTGTATVADQAAATAPGEAAQVPVTATFTATAVAAAASGLAFVQQPVDADAGLPILPQVAVLDAHGNTVAADSSTSVTFAIVAGTGTAGASLLGTNPVVAVGGVVDPTDLAVDLPGTDYQIIASATGLAADTSAAFSIAVGAVSTITVSPAQDTIVSLGDSAAFTPSAQDGTGNPVMGLVYSWSSSDSSVAIPNAAGFAVAIGNGSATITASSGGVSGSATVVVQQVATQLSFSVEPGNAMAGDTIPIEVQAQDALGSVVSGFTGSVSLAFVDNPGSATLLGTTAVPAVAGVAQFTDISLDSAGTGYTLEATSGALAADTSAAFDITVGALTTISLSPSVDTVLALADSVLFTPTAMDGSGNVLGGVTYTWSSSDSTVAIPNAQGYAVALGNGSAAIMATSGGIDGTATLVVTQTVALVDISPDSTSLFSLGDTTTYTASVEDANGNVMAIAPTWEVTDSAVASITSGGLVTALSDGVINVIATAGSVADTAVLEVLQNAVSIAFTTEPVNSPAGNVIPMEVQAFDSLGNLVTGFSSNVALTFLANPGGSNLNGTTNVAASGGIATFTDVYLDAVGTGYTLVATSSALADTSVAFNITPGTASSLSFTTEPVDAVAGAVIPMQVTALDGQGNVDTSFAGSVTLTFANNPGGSTLGGNSSVTAVNGVADFTTVFLDQAGDNYQLTASSGALNTNSAQFDITPGAATALSFTTEPTDAAAGSVIPMQVAALDGFGNVDTSYTATVTLTFAANPGGSVFGGTAAVAAVNGVVDFTTVFLDQVGSNYQLTASDGSLSTNSAQFDVTPGAATALSFTTEPTDAGAGSVIPMQVTAYDGFGNVDTSYTATVTLTFAANPGGSVFGGTAAVAAVNGVADFTTVFLDQVGSNYQLTASDGSLSTNSAQFDITPGSATALSFTTEPTDAAAGSVIPMQVTAYDGFGNVDTSYTATVTLTFAANPGGSVFGGTAAVAAVNGVADFTTVFLDQAGANYQLTASDGSLSTNSAQFDITPGAATALSFTTEPTDAAAGSVIPMQVAALDGFGNVDTSYTATVTLTFAANPGGSVFGGTAAVAAVNGVADFTTVFLDQAGANYQLTASDGSLSTNSAQFDVTPGAATALSFTTEPTDAGAGSVIPMQVTAYDGFGNVDTSYTATVTLTFAANPGGSVFGGTAAVAAVNGVADFTTVFLDQVGSNYQLTASDGSLSTNSAQFDITPGAATTLSFTTEPVNSSAGDTIPMQVTALDGFGNVDTAFTSNVDLAFNANPGSSTLNGTTSVAAVNGVADFTTIWLDRTGTSYAFDASSGALGPVTSASFDITADTLATITLTPTADTILAIGDSVLYTPTASDVFGNTITGLAYTWGTLDSSIAIPDVNGLGYAVAVANGSTTIIATSGNVSGNATVVVAVAQVRWITAGGDWNNTANWSTGALPTANDTVFIDNAGSYTVNLNVSASIARLVLGNGTDAQQLNVESPNTLTLSDGGVVASNATLHQNGNLSTAAALDISGTHQFTAGTLTGAGPTNVLANGTMAIDSSALKILDGHMVTTTGTGAITVAGTGSVQADNSPTITNGGTFDIQSDADFVQGNSSGTIDNSGTLQKSAGATTASLAWTVNNTGQLTSQAATGTLSLDGGGTHTGGFTADGVLNFGGGSPTITGGVSGTGTFGVTAGSVTLSGTYGVTTTDISGGTVAFNTTGTSTTSAFTQSGGTVDGSATLQLTGTSDWSGGDWTGSGSTDVTGTGTLTISGTAARTLDQRTVNNSGAVAVTGVMTITVDNNGVINNLAGGSFDAQAPATITPTVALDGSFNNAGMFTRTTAGGPFTIDVPFTSTDTVDVQVGTLQLNGGDGGSPYTNTFLLTGDTLAFGGGNTVSYTVQDSVVGTGTLLVGVTGTDLFINGYYHVGKTVVDGGAILWVTNLPDTAVTDTLLNLNGAAIDGAGVIAVADTALFDGGAWWTGTTYVMPGAHLVIGTRNLRSLNNGRRLDVAGTMTFPAGGGSRVMQFNTNSVLNIQSTGLVDLQNNRSLGHNGVNAGTANIQNAGILRKSTAGATDTSVIQIPIVNTGTGVVDIVQGALRFDSTLTHPASAIIQGVGTLDLQRPTIASFEGDIDPGTAGVVDTLAIDRTGGTLTMGSASGLNVDVASTTSSDQLVVAGTIDMTNGTVNIDATGASLVGGETFTIVVGTTVTGTPAIGTVTGYAPGFTIANVGGTAIVITAQ